MNSKNIVIVVLVLVLLGAVTYLALINKNSDVMVINEPDVTEDTDVMPVEPDNGIGDGAEPIPEETGETLLGRSINGKDIIAYRFGTGEKEVLLIGGIHGSYSPNTAALANEAINYFETNPSEIPENVQLTIIPNLNPDGLTMSGTEGRFNASKVDLNRNFDCEWSAIGVWRDKEVSGGSEAFSEPEAVALRDYVLANDPEAAIVLFSAEGKVYPSACEGTPSNASVTLAATYANAAGYPTEAEFDAYAITGDMVNWMAKQEIPAISVLLTDHTNTEWSKNLAGIKAVLKAQAQ